MRACYLNVQIIIIELARDRSTMRSGELSYVNELSIEVYEHYWCCLLCFSMVFMEKSPFKGEL